MTKSKLPAAWPWGAGSMQFRSRTWWLIYRNTEGRVVQENSKYQDHNSAFQVLIDRALEVARHRLEVIEEIAREATKTKARRADPDDREARDDTQQPARRRSNRNDAALRGDGKTTRRDGKTTTKGGHRQ